jgi:hypothetical protein
MAEIATSSYCDSLKIIKYHLGIICQININMYQFTLLCKQSKLLFIAYMLLLEQEVVEHCFFCILTPKEE